MNDIDDLEVTILILLETLLQLLSMKMKKLCKKSHNPYFTGNSFAIPVTTIIEDIKNESQSLFYWKLFCNWLSCKSNSLQKSVTILILLETLLQ